jgi:hypothetical protein
MIHRRRVAEVLQERSAILDQSQQVFAAVVRPDHDCSPSPFGGADSPHRRLL